MCLRHIYTLQTEQKQTISPLKQKNRLTFIRLVGTELPKKSPNLGQVVGQTKSSWMA